MSRPFSTMLLATAALAVCLPASRVQAELPQTMAVGDAHLELNGWGARHKYFMQMYVAGLYLQAPSNQPADIIAADAPMAIRLKISSRLVSQEKLVASLHEGFEAATKGNVEPIRNEIAQFRGCFADELQKGDVIDVVYQPGEGVVVQKNGKRAGVVPGLAFKQALFGIWLSENPADADLKEALLVARRRG